MRARCPHCNSVFQTDRGGIQFCPGCGQQVNVPAPPPPGGTPDTAAAPGAGEPGASPTGAGGSLPPPPPPPPQVSGARCAIHPEVSATTTCHRCGTFICGSCEQRAPDGAVYCPPCFQLLGLNEGAPTPWEDRGRVGLIKGLFLTVKDVCFAPDRFWRTVDPRRSWVDALLFSWAINAIATIVALPLTMLQYGSQMEAIRAQRDMPEEFERFFELLMNPAGFAVFMLILVILYPVGFIMMAGVSHLAMIVTGGNKNGFEASARAVGYAAAPLLIGSIPCIGVVGSLYSLVLVVWGLGAIHRTDWWRALVGLIAAWFIVGCCIGGVAIAIGAAAAGLR